jgi:hypothetical protein
MSPEQVEGREIDHRADLFSAGVVLHEVLTGRRLFKGASDIQTIAKVREAKVAPPSHFNPEVPHELDRICMRALAREPDDRYRSGEEMAAELDQVVHELKWGADRVAVTLRELFPEEPSFTHAPVVEAPNFGQLSKRSLARRRRFRVAMVLAAIALLAAAGTWAFVLRVRFLPPSVPPAAASPLVAAPAPPPPPAPVEAALPKEVQVWVRSAPESAEVFVDDEAAPRGRTPLKIDLPRGQDARHLSLRSSGYQEYRTDVVPDANNRVEVTLVAVPKPPRKASGSPHKAARPVAPASRPSPPPAKPPPDVAGGDLVTPFSH